uniref:Uncharacterized protein n=1 Tax=Trypanosoma vivax (strain Y486) TaxID=1055687 RepID=G0TT43_TRYVY|nr:hypothetical protein TVY486_0303100 [Trypanosoma vivax Y486]
MRRKSEWLLPGKKHSNFSLMRLLSKPYLRHLRTQLKALLICTHFDTSFFFPLFLFVLFMFWGVSCNFHAHPSPRIYRRACVWSSAWFATFYFIVIVETPPRST